MVIQTLLLVVFGGQVVTARVPADAPQLTAGDTCIASEDPRACMQGYGFTCDRSRTPQRSVEAFRLSCNVQLAGDLMHYVQILFDDGGWAVETQETYPVDYDDGERIADDPESMLADYIRDSMTNYGKLGSRAAGPGRPVQVTTGFRRSGDLISMRTMCGALVGEGTDPTLLAQQRLPETPHTQNLVEETRWQTTNVTLATGDAAFIVDGLYDFPPGHKSCRLGYDCCSAEGATYLDSCRTPTEAEFTAINACLADGLEVLSGEHLDCLRGYDVNVGCEEQPDGSRTCF